MSGQGRGRFGVCGVFGAGSSKHRPSVAFGFASAPARRPAVACGGARPRAALATFGRLDGLLAWLEPDSPVGASGWFFVPCVREPGTAERESTGLGPESDRRMPGTRPSCPRRLASPVRDVTCFVESAVTRPAGHEKGRTGGKGDSGPTGAVPGARRSLPGPTRRATFSAAPGSATRVSENLLSGAWHPPRALRCLEVLSQRADHRVR
jgi:hypothetical protein